MTWKFNSHIEKIYDEHVLAHIPNYERVITKSLDVCNTVDRDSPIIDVGCANGATLYKLYNMGFSNLHGVDSSSEMVSNISNIANIKVSTKLPVGPYKIILANWVLHFINDKETYLNDVYNNLLDDGIFILSEKINLDNNFVNHYYNIKRQHGVTDSEIAQKEKSLQGVMFVKSRDWYIQTLKTIGFTRIEVIDADWCFNTFYIQK